MAASDGFSIGVAAMERRRAMNLNRAARHEAERQQRDFAAARINRLTGDWVTTILSADQSLKGDLRRLRGGARALVRDNGFATRYVNMIAENVIGHQGIQLQSTVKSTRGKMNKSLNQQVESAWMEWGFPENCSANGRLSWIDMQALQMKTAPADGEYCVRMLRGYDNPFLFALEPVDVDLIDEMYNGIEPNGNEVRMGVEVDRYGRVVAYHMWTRHPSDTGTLAQTRRRERVPAEDIIHDGITLRPGQTRFLPWFTPVMIDQKMTQAYQEAEITAARIGASNMAAVGYDPDKGGSAIANPRPGESAIPVEMEPGRFLRLGPGETLMGTDFNHPSTAFGPFMKVVQRAIASGLNVSYTSMSGDLEAVNYSSIRAGLLSERDFYRGLQVWFSARFHRRVFNEWVRMAALAGKLPAASVDAIRAPGATRWRARGWAWVDPRNDIEAAHLEIALGINSRDQICAERGRDFEETIDSLKHEQDVATEAGVSINPLSLTVKGQDPNTDPSGDNATGPAAATPTGASDGEETKSGRSRLRVTS